MKTLERCVKSVQISINKVHVRSLSNISHLQNTSRLQILLFKIYENEYAFGHVCIMIVLMSDVNIFKKKKLILTYYMFQLDIGCKLNVYT